MLGRQTELRLVILVIEEKTGEDDDKMRLCTTMQKGLKTLTQGLNTQRPLRYEDNSPMDIYIFPRYEDNSPVDVYTFPGYEGNSPADIYTFPGYEGNSPVEEVGSEDASPII